VKCSLCGKEFEVYDLFCLNRGGGANSLCDSECILLCENCLKVVKRTIMSLDSI